MYSIPEHDVVRVVFTLATNCPVLEIELFVALEFLRWFAEARI